MKDRYSDDQPSKPAAGGDTNRHAGKGDVSTPGCGYVEHPEKVGPGEGGISKPSHGGHVREQKRDETVSKPHGGDEEIPKDNLHSDKQKKHRDRDRHVEPRPKGDSDSSGRPFKSAKVD